MEPKRKLQQRAEQDAAHAQQLGAQQRQTVREFHSVEELLQHDAAQTTVPPAVAARLQESLAREPAPRGNWWRRLFGE
jgi:hypothetical protein